MFDFLIGVILLTLTATENIAEYFNTENRMPVEKGTAHAFSLDLYLSTPFTLKLHFETP